MNYIYVHTVRLCYIDIFDEINRSVKTWSEKERLFDLTKHYDIDDNNKGKRKILNIIRRCVLNNFPPYEDIKHMIELVDLEYKYTFDGSAYRDFTVIINVGDKNDVRKFKLKYPKWHEYLSNDRTM